MTIRYIVTRTDKAGTRVVSGAPSSQRTASGCADRMRRINPDGIFAVQAVRI